MNEVQRDLDTGYITAAGAERDYGCVVRDGLIDAAATAARRGSQRES